MTFALGVLTGALLVIVPLMTWLLASDTSWWHSGVRR